MADTLGGPDYLIHDPVPLADLIRHMDMFYTRFQLEHDLDCVFALCESESDRSEVKRFARAKLAGKSYTAPVGSVSVSGTVCGQCGKRFSIERSTARFCSAACRVKHSRRIKPSVLR